MENYYIKLNGEIINLGHETERGTVLVFLFIKTDSIVLFLKIVEQSGENFLEYKLPKGQSKVIKSEGQNTQEGGTK